MHPGYAASATLCQAAHCRLSHHQLPCCLQGKGPGSDASWLRASRAAPVLLWRIQRFQNWLHSFFFNLKIRDPLRCEVLDTSVLRCLTAPGRHCSSTSHRMSLLSSCSWQQSSVCDIAEMEQSHPSLDPAAASVVVLLLTVNLLLTFNGF